MLLQWEEFHTERMLGKRKEAICWWTTGLDSTFRIQQKAQQLWKTSEGHRSEQDHHRKMLHHSTDPANKANISDHACDLHSIKNGMHSRRGRRHVQQSGNEQKPWGTRRVTKFRWSRRESCSFHVWSVQCNARELKGSSQTNNFFVREGNA